MGLFSALASATGFFKKASGGDPSYYAKTPAIVAPEAVKALAPAQPTIWLPTPTPTPKAGLFDRYPQAFLRAVVHALDYEMSGGGRLFNIYDPLVIKGDISTPEGRRKNGYTTGTGANDQFDHGGETKLGIAQKAHPEVVVRNLDIFGVLDIYLAGYWKACKCDQFKGDVSCELFDIACGSGPVKAAKILQQAVGVTVDGVIGPMTIAAANQMDPAALVAKMAQIREAFYVSIAVGDQARFKNGWVKRARDTRWDLPVPK